MNKNSYKECYKTTNTDNQWLLDYDEKFINNENSKFDDIKQDRLGSDYTSARDWYYQWDRDEKHYYVVVD